MANKRKPKVGEKKVRTVYKRRGRLHVCHDGEYFSPKDGQTVIKAGDKVSVESTRTGSHVLVTVNFGATDVPDAAVTEHWSYDRVLAGKDADPRTGRKVGERKPKLEPEVETPPTLVEPSEPQGTVIDVLSGESVDLGDEDEATEAAQA